MVGTVGDEYYTNDALNRSHQGIMRTDAISLRYGSRRTRDRVIKVLRDISNEHRLPIKVERIIFPGFGRADLDIAERQIWTPGMLQNLGLSRAPLLTQSRIERLGRKLPLWHYQAGGDAQGLRLDAFVAARNEYPALGFEVCPKSRLALFGGFVWIEAKRFDELKAASCGLRSRLRIPIPAALRI